MKNYGLGLIEAISLVTKNPAEILNLDAGKISEKSEADLIIFDLEKPWKVEPNSFHSKSKNSPFDSLLVEGRNIMTFVRGRLVYKF